ncbi:MAG: A24 family peptidase [Schaedlerella sp.]|nr:A24 family peptidase [Schaedlerella sp.]
MFQLDFSVDKAGLLWEIIGCCYLLLLSIQDIRTRMVSQRILIIGGTLALIVQSVLKLYPLELCVAGGLLGVLFIGISRLTREALGYGDSFLITILGIFLGIWNLMYVLVIAFIISALVSMVVLIRFCYNRKKTLPFIPFLTAGYMAFIILEKI